MAITFVRPALMKWAGTKVTDHNRSQLSVSVERIEKKHRTANGSSRKFVVADKRTFSCSWDMLPKPTAKTVDGFLGGQGIEDFYNANQGSFALALYDADGTINTYQVMFTEFSKDIVKRGSVDFWNVSLSMEEV